MAYKELGTKCTDRDDMHSPGANGISNRRTDECRTDEGEECRTEEQMNIEQLKGKNVEQKNR
jgi:hypothetical protein